MDNSKIGGGSDVSILVLRQAQDEDRNWRMDPNIWNAGEEALIIWRAQDEGRNWRTEPIDRNAGEEALILSLSKDEGRAVAAQSVVGSAELT